MLEEYHRKRDFSKSPEPEGRKGEKGDMDIKIIDKEEIKENGKKNGEKNGIFVIHEHKSRRLHWDLRLEMGGVLRSWAVPKNPVDVNNGIKRLAIQVEDHPIEYAEFEGTIPEGSYGAGTVEIYDSGELVVEEETDSKISFQLKGKKLTGKYALVKVPNMGKNSWLFFKMIQF